MVLTLPLVTWCYLAKAHSPCCQSLDLVHCDWWNIPLWTSHNRPSRHWFLCEHSWLAPSTDTQESLEDRAWRGAAGLQGVPRGRPVVLPKVLPIYILPSSAGRIPSDPWLLQLSATTIYFLPTRQCKMEPHGLDSRLPHHWWSWQCLPVIRVKLGFSFTKVLLCPSPIYCAIHNSLTDQQENTWHHLLSVPSVKNIFSQLSCFCTCYLLINNVSNSIKSNLLLPSDKVNVLVALKSSYCGAKDTFNYIFH